MAIDQLSSQIPFVDTEEACADYLFRLKWPTGFSCPVCRFRHAYVITTRRLPLYECSSCGHQTSLTAGTIMEGSKTPLTKWFTAIRLISDTEHGISALSLSRIISVTYKTAWSLLHKIRFAMGKAITSDRLTGDVILNDACYGRPHNPSIELHRQETPVLIGASMSEMQPARIVIRVVAPEHLDNKRILPAGTDTFKKQHLSRDAIIRECFILRYTPRKFKRAWPLFRQAQFWINSTFHGLGKKYLQAYFHEFSCRTNMLFAASPIFEGIGRLCATTRTITNKSLVRRATVLEA